MIRKKSAWIILCVMTSLLNACNEKAKSNDKDLNGAAIQKSAFTKPIVTLVSPDNAATQLFGINNCRVYKGTHAQNEPAKWELIFKPAFYPAPKICVLERLEIAGEYLQIEIGTQAMGAGGCCTTYAAYRSRDGETWEFRPATSMKEWQSLKD